MNYCIRQINTHTHTDNLLQIIISAYFSTLFTFLSNNDNDVSLVSVFDERLVKSLQLQMSTRGLLDKSIGNAGKFNAFCAYSPRHIHINWFCLFPRFPFPDDRIDGEHLLVVLHRQVHWILRHALLHSAQKDGARVDVTRHPSRLHALLGLDGSQVRSR